jgi:hypothetical protein
MIFIPLSYGCFKRIVSRIEEQLRGLLDKFEDSRYYSELEVREVR